MPSFDQTPDQPGGFGYKVSWFAIKTSDPVSVLDALELGEVAPANWASGFAVACGDSDSDDRWVFISPPLNGWVLAISDSWPYPTAETHHDIGAKFDVLFSRLIKRFDDVQFFGSHRVSDFAAWARAVNGKPTRIFANGDGQVLMNIGAQTAEEAKLRLVDLTGLSRSDAEEKIFSIAEEQDDEDGKGRIRVFPGEEEVVDLAALWASTPLSCLSQVTRPVWGWQFACRTI
jgi:hypothetical protein